MYSQAVTHPSTNTAQHCLTSVIRRELVLSVWYGPRQGTECIFIHCLNSVCTAGTKIMILGWICSGKTSQLDPERCRNIIVSCWLVSSHLPWRKNLRRTQRGYTPLVEVNQALIAWSFRQLCKYSLEFQVADRFTDPRYCCYKYYFIVFQNNQFSPHRGW